jgi:hypothetical protein
MREDASMLKRLAGMTLALVVTLGFVAATQAADEITLNGTVVCAKCSLKKADAKVCHNVLVVTGKAAGEYYFVKNAASDKYGEVCTAKKPVVVTGKVSEKDGKKWIEASKIEDVKG